ncbi:FV3-083R, partial [Symbiodinium pilosum]
KSGKTVALISAILEQYRTADGSSVFERIYIFSPSIEIDDGWRPVKEFIENEMGVNTEREQVYFDKWDEGALRTIIEQQKKITKTSKHWGEKTPLHRRTGDGALDTLFIRGRHMQISTWVSSQKLRLISAAVRVNTQFICIWRLRNQLELEAVLEELTALLPKQELLAMYHEATKGAL